MRLFTAVDPPDPLREELASIQNRGSLPARWTTPEQFHVTLRFIGEVNEAEARRYEEALSDVNVPPIHLAPYGLDVLPSRRSPRVLMLGFDRTESLMGLYRAVSDALETEGLEPEDRRYRPHITFARLDDPEPESVHAFLRNHDDRSFEPFEVDRFVLYESTLTPEGAIHEPYASFELTA